MVNPDEPPLVIAVLGLGEAGSVIARDLVAAGAVVRGYDPAVAAGPGITDTPGEAVWRIAVEVNLVAGLSLNCQYSLHGAPGTRRRSSSPCRSIWPATMRLAEAEVPYLSMAFLAAAMTAG